MNQREDTSRRRIELPRRSIPPPADGTANPVYRVVSGGLVAFARLFWGMTIEGTEHVPATGSYIVAPVHRSNIDFALVSGLTRRRMRFMGKETIWKYRFLWPLFDALGGFPVQRGTADRESLRACVEIIEQGEPLVLFPEGTRQSGDRVATLFEGAAYLAVRTGVPIVPVGIGGSEAALPKGAKLPRRVKVRLVVGPPMAPSAPAGAGRAPRRAVRELTAALQVELQRLFDLASDPAAVQPAPGALERAVRRWR